MESGYSPAAAYTVAMKLDELACALPEGNEIRYIQKIDNVLFCHGGLLDYFVKQTVPVEKYHDVDEVVRIINGLPREYMWSDVSPIWHRPQYTAGKMYGDEKILQVVGHTPVEKIYREGNVISCDVFSTYRDGRAIGTEEFLVVDTESWEYGGVKAKKNLDIAEIQNTLLKQMEDYLEGLISKEKYAEDAEQFYSKYGHCIEETEFDEVFSEAIPDCCIVNVDEPGDEDLKEKDFHEIMADTYQKLKGLVDS